MAAALLTGCASPGQPKPPSLQLPQTVKDLTASRAGSVVHLEWATPSSTTDNLPVPPHIFAVLCRQAGHGPCTVVQRFPVHPGESQADDPLPADLATGPAGLLAYRIEILNPAGRSAGRSPEAFAASGAAPPPISGLTATPIRRGMRLTWKSDAPALPVELDRTELAHPTPAVQHRSPKLPGAARNGPEVHLSAGAAGQPAPGGTIDRSTHKGGQYRYIAQRRQTIVIAGHTLTLTSAPSLPVLGTMVDTFPPDPPAGLEAAPGGGTVPSVDLSWRPGAEADLLGYNIYRREPGAGPDPGPDPGSWHRLNAAPISVPAYSDAAVSPGTRYIYRITALDADGNESAPSVEVQETPGTR